MSGLRPPLTHFEHREFARISRWVRDGEQGWMFAGPEGEYRLLTDEAARLESEARALVSRAQQGGLGPSREMCAIVTASLSALAGGAMMWAGADSIAIAAATFLAACLAWRICDFAVYIAYRRSLSRWRNQTAAALTKGGRKDRFAAKGYARRVNLFKGLHIACIALVLSAQIGIFVLAAGDDAMLAASVAFTVVALCPLGLVGQWGRKRIDMTHTRRKWFDW